MKWIIILVTVFLLFGLIKVNAQQGVGATYEDCQGLHAVNAGWFYNWGRTPPLCDGVESVPMLWCTNSVGQELGGDSEWLLGFNEPDAFSQCNKTPLQGALAWRQVEEAYPDKLLVSPAVMWVPWLSVWRDAYVSEYGRPPRVDAVAIHCYVWVDEPWQAVDYCQQQVSAAYALGFGDVWVTEYAWLGPDVQRGVEYMLRMRMWLERDERVARWAWFELSYEGGEPWAWPWNTSLIDYHTGDLTQYGRSYRGFYQTFMPEVRKWD